MALTHRRTLATVIAALGLGIATATTPTAAATEAAAGVTTERQFASYEEAVPGVAPAGAAATATYLDASGNKISMPGAANSERVASCTPYSGRDNPHRSSTGTAVSAHGWWDKGTCSSDRADVYNCLYEWYTDNTWRRKDCSPTERLKPGGGSSNRTVARRDCANTSRTSWRNHVDVDVVDEWDSGEQPYRQADVACRVY